MSWGNHLLEERLQALDSRGATKAGSSALWPNGVSATVLLHEIAHSMTSDAASGRSHAHGPRFVGALMTLLCDLIPTFSLDALMVSARQEGIEFNFDGPIHL